MSHHSSNADPEIDAALLRKLTDVNERLGPTGNFPRGHLTPTDEGGLMCIVPLEFERLLPRPEPEWLRPAIAAAFESGWRPYGVD